MIDMFWNIAPGLALIAAPATLWLLTASAASWKHGSKSPRPVRVAVYRRNERTTKR